MKLFIKRTNIPGMVIKVVQLLTGTDKLAKLTSIEVSSIEVILVRHNLMIEKNNIIWNSY